MSKFLLLLCAAAMSLASCSDSSEDISQLKANGGMRYGGTFRFMSPEKINGFLPIQSVDLITQRVTSQLFEPLLGLDPSGKNIIPCLAESFKVSSDGKTYTFKIRNGVYFHDDDCFGGEGRELTSEDVKFTLDMACSGLKMNEVSWLLVDRVVGAKGFYDKTGKEFKEGGVEGIKATDKNTLVITLSEPCASFDKMMTFAGFGVFPKEAYDTYGNDLKNHPVGTGPFRLESDTKSKIRLARNNRYWKKDDFGNQLPFLEAVEITFATDKRSELMAFRNAEIDLVLEVPADEVENVLGSLQEAQAGKTVKHKVDSQQSASVTYVALSHANPVFKDVNVRKAFNMSIDRDELVNQTLMGDGYPALNGIIPNTDFFNSSKVKGEKYDVSAARALLAKAGYPNGAGFPELTFYVNGVAESDNHVLARKIAQDLKESLNIKLKVKLVSSNERNDAVASGKASIWLTGWIADYPDPENYLGLFYGGNIKADSKFINPYKYKNPAFDNLYQQIGKEQNVDKRTELIVKADQILVDDAVVIPILTDDFITMTNSRIRNLETNSLEMFNLSNTFIKEPK